MVSDTGFYIAIKYSSELREFFTPLVLDNNDDQVVCYSLRVSCKLFEDFYVPSLFSLSA